MRLNWLKFVSVLMIITGWANLSNAQGYSFNCARDTVLPGCPAAACFTIKTLIPDPHRQSTDYAVNAPSTLPSCLLNSGNPGVPGAPTTLNLDDRYSPVFPIGFPFVFFGTAYTDLVVSSNGFLSFDAALTGLFSHWNIINGGTPQDLPSTFYDRALIMGPYHDIDVAITTSPNRLISYQTNGLAPYRTWTITYYKIPLFSAACNNLIENTHQITLYESTGIIDVAIYDMQICLGWNEGRAMVGVQNYNRDAGVMVPGRRASDPPWGSVGMYEKWRFVPIGGTPLFRRAELYTMAGALVSTGTTVQLPNGDREASFPNICMPAGSSTQYVIKAFYDKIDDPTVEIFGSDTITVDRSQGLAAEPTSSAASCGVANGGIIVTNTSGGTGPYEYSLDGIAWQSSPTFTGLLSGTYTVYVRDAAGVCTANYSIVVPVIGNLAAVTSNTATACTGVNSGTITISSSTGTAPFTFSLDGGTFVAGALPYTFTGLTSGNHTVVIKDVNGCETNTITINITTGTGVLANTSFTPTSCPGANNGTITVNVTAGTAPFTYQLGAGPIQPSNVFTGLASGTYSITVRDALGCSRIVTRTVTNGSSVTATTALTATTCGGAANGSVTITPTSGTGPYTFVLDGVTTQTGATNTVFTGLTSGSHSVVITDDPSACQSLPITFTIAAGPTLLANAVPSATSCSGASNGTITVTPTNGTAPYTFSIDGGAFVPGGVPYTFTNIPAGPHTVRVTDASGCVTNTINADIAAGPALTTTASKTDALCNGDATGTITVTTPTIGTAPYEYSLDGTIWQLSNIFNGLAAGTYTVYYRESNGCQGSQTINVAEPVVLSATASTVAVVCNGQNNGIITVTSNGGVAPHEYSINGGAAWTPNNIFNVAAGTYTITIRDANGCSTTQTITVTEPTALAAFSANGPASCDGGNDGLITVTANGGNAGYQYSLDGVAFQSSNTFNVAPGNYTVTVKDNLGCTTSFPTTVVLSNNLTLTPQTDPTICEGTSTQLALTSNATEYSWTPSTGLSSTTIYNPIANPTVTTQYTVTATLGRCSADDIVMVNVHAAPIPDAGVDGFICYGQTHQLQGSGGTVYSWTPATYLDNPSISNPVSTPTKDVIYTMSIVSDANGCASLTTDQMRIDVTPPIKVKTFPYDTVAYNADQFMLLAIPSDSDVINYSWTPTMGLSDPAIANPIVTVGAIGEVVQYQVIASTLAGCKGEGYITVRVYKGPDIYVPTGFTPNGDGRNDLFTPFPVGVKSYKYFRVFNRWGQMVFSTNTLNHGWDGKLRGVDQPSGVYVWMIEGMTKNDRVITKKGTVAIIR
ncbi:MAG TPA: gliding motility-associated C-terminal domain-containing protein [Chitinophagaceae bacterium]|jgi:gliding motility-associated-like protein|nr:gliding motility-associated C-terminal domain-containing protein [Chitinophagaceae bacterium]